MTPIWLALGGNIGDRRHFLDEAVRRLRASAGLALHRVSAYYETAPVGGPADAGAYLNAVASGATYLSPEDLLQRLFAVEAQLGRVRSERNAPRTIDLDLLLYGDQVRTGPDPIVPHPRLHERRFVLVPLAEIAADVVHPVLRKSIGQLAAELPGDEPPPVPRVFPAVDRFRLDGKTALVTGATSGIGRAIAEELAFAGCRVAVHGRRFGPRAHEIAERIGNGSTAVTADLAVAAERSALIEHVTATFGKIDVFVANAGADLLTGDARQWSFEKKWAMLQAVDVEATVTMARMVGSIMRKAGSGSIITLGWDQAETGMEGDSGQLFGAAKAAVTAFSRSLAVELAPEVRVNVVAPGWIKTAWGESAPPEWQDRVIRETPAGRWGLADDVAGAVRWLAGSAADFVTGQVIRVNGGAVR